MASGPCLGREVRTSRDGAAVFCASLQAFLVGLWRTGRQGASPRDDSVPRTDSNRVEPPSVKDRLVRSTPGRFERVHLGPWEKGDRPLASWRAGVEGYSVVRFTSETLGLGLAAPRHAAAFFGEGLAQAPRRLHEADAVNGYGKRGIPAV